MNRPHYNDSLWAVGFYTRVSGYKFSVPLAGFNDEVHEMRLLARRILVGSGSVCLECVEVFNEVCVTD